jgi:hypothetical protein
MTIKTFLVLTFVCFLVENGSFGEDQKATASSEAKQSAAAKPLPSAEELEAKFKALLTKATLSGRWTPIKDGSLGPEKEDKYTIVSAGKVSGDSWVVNAKLKYGEREFVAPLPVKVRWAGDTAVLIVDNLQMPGGRNTYSARVLFFGNTDAGTWSGGDHGGLLSGIISNEKDEKPQAQPK